MAKPLIKVDVIYQAALELASKRGAGQLTIRNLTQELNCSPNTIYAQVGDRDGLIQGMLDLFFQANPVSLPYNSGWLEQCRYWAEDFHQLLINNPDLTRLMSLRQRPAIAERVNALLDKLLSAGFDAEFALRCVRVLSNQTVAFSLLEIELPPAFNLRRNRTAEEMLRGNSILLGSQKAGNLGQYSTAVSDQSEIFSSAIEFTLRGIESAYTELKKK